MKPRYFLTCRTCFTRFSITPSKASFSPSWLSLRFSQYSNTSLARVVTCSRFSTWSFSSTPVSPSSAASVVAHKRRTANRSSSGGAVWPLRLGAGRCDGERAESIELEERDWPSGCFFLLLGRALALSPPAVVGVEFEFPSKFMDGNTSFFCFEAGRISSRSTGTPRETRNRRRIRDFVQLGGCSGGGATSCDQSDNDRSVLNTAEEFEKGSTGARAERSIEFGNRVSRWSVLASISSEYEPIGLKSMSGG